MFAGNSRHVEEEEEGNGPIKVSLDDAFEGYGRIIHAYPLVNIVVAGPVSAESGKFMISISDRDGRLLRGVKREEAERPTSGVPQA